MQHESYRVHALGVAGAKSSITAKTHRLMLDGSNVESNAARSGHLCAAKPVGCGPAGVQKFKQLSLHDSARVVPSL